jgi:hypothetical protein
LYSQTSSNTTLFGDGLAAMAAVRMLTAARKGVQVVPEYSVHPLTLRGRDVIVIGSPNYSPVAARVLRQAPFSVRYDPATRLEVVSTEDPNREGGASYSSERGQSMGLKLAYGLITVLPGPGPNDDTRRIVLFSGISSAGTQAAVEYFCSPGQSAPPARCSLARNRSTPARPSPASSAEKPCLRSFGLLEAWECSAEPPLPFPTSRFDRHRGSCRQISDSKRNHMSARAVRA